MMARPDQKNQDQLNARGKQIGFGTQVVKLTWHDGWLAKWEEIEAHPGHQAPLEKEPND